MNLRVVAILPAILALAAGCAGTGRPQATATSTTTATVTARVTVPPSRPAQDSLVAGYYQPLWPFANAREARTWTDQYRPQGHQPWHLDAAFTAQAFTQGYLGLQQIDQVVSTEVSGSHARVAVGFRSPESTRALTAAVIHLVRYGDGVHAPWEVVGTDDTTLTLAVPAYGSAVRSPMTVGGRVTGVDESIRVRVHQPWSAAPLAEVTGVPAGGEKHPWSAQVSFDGRPGQVTTIVASTGGHLAEVERFAVTGVTVGRTS